MLRTSFAGPLILIAASIVNLAGQQTALDEAAAAFEQGRASEAGQKLDTFLKSHPADLRALILKGAVLDSLQQYGEAEGYYLRALKLAPGSGQVLNNAGNHYLASGNRMRARELYLKAVAADAHQSNANLQLAQMSVDEKRGAEALGYLNRLDESSSADPGVRMLRARALALAGQCDSAVKILGELEGHENPSASSNFSTGMVFAQCKNYDRAEKSFSSALDADPRDFDVLYNLGLAALGAGHAERAAAVLETARSERPEDVDCLVALARAYLAQKRTAEAAVLLAKAQNLSAGRADVLLLLAQASFRLEFYEDAAATYTRYLKIEPGDDTARRERGMASACAGQAANALADLEWYVHKHPNDAVGYYELAVAEQLKDQAKASQALDRALALDPSMIQARYTRGVLNLEDERPGAAVDDLRFVREREPSNYRVLVNLGRAYLGAGRAAEAAQTLASAIELAPNQPAALIHYHRALEKLGRKEEAAAVLARLKQADSGATLRKPQAGLLEYLSLTPAEQRARYLANLRRYAEASPSDPRWKIRLGRELLAEGKTGEAQDVFRSMLSTPAGPEMRAECGRILLDAGEYELAQEFLQPALAAAPAMSEARLDLATALFHRKGAAAALAVLDQTPAGGQKGDYYLLRAQILDAEGKVTEAADALNQGMRAAPTRSSLYLQAAGFLLKHKLYDKALALLEQASRIMPNDRELLMTRAVTLAVTTRDDDAQKLLTSMQARWPEWDRPYLLNGMILEMQLKSTEALPLLDTAIALGANTPEAYYYEALAITHSRPNDLDGAHEAISRALALTMNDPYIFLLAGKISLARRDYPAAIQQLSSAIKLQPALIPAHYALHDAYKATGDESKSAAELEAIQRIADQNAAPEASPFPVEDFVFQVRPPG